MQFCTFQVICTILLMFTSFVKMDLKKIWDKFRKPEKPPNCEQYTSQLINLLNLVCNNIADLDVQDCIQCFNAASRSSNNQPSLLALRDCAENYLLGTDYGDCVSLIDAAATSSTSACVTGYCNFVQCLRRQNADGLIDRCFQESAVDDGPFDDSVTLMKDVISCILTAARCESINPVTGQEQSSVVTTITTDKWGKTSTSTVALYNSLQITPEGDLRIIRFPGTTAVQNYFCSRQASIQQSPC